MSTHAHYASPMDAHAGAASLSRLAFSATLHCLSGCAIGEIAGIVIGTSLGWGMWETVALAVTLAFITGFGLTMIPLIRGGMQLGRALRIAFAADFISVTVMEIVDNAVMMAIPGAMLAGPVSLLFWASLALALGIAFAVAWPVNYWLIMRGKGHAVVHHLHHRE
jgi:Domain of unknown function (DUF4396)